MHQNWRPWTLEIYAFIQEGLQKSLFPPSSKNLTKCLPKCHQNGAKSSNIQLRRPPRKHSKNKRRKQHNFDSKSRGGGPRTKLSHPQLSIFDTPLQRNACLQKVRKSQQKIPFLKHAFRYRGGIALSRTETRTNVQFRP